MKWGDDKNKYEDETMMCVDFFNDIVKSCVVG